MRTQPKAVLAIAGIALAASVGAQTIVYERPNPVVIYEQSNPVVIYPANDVYQARVLSSRPVNAAPQERCWTERHQVGLLELPFAIVGGTIDLLAGQQSTRYDQRCTTVRGTAYWDVTYEFRGIEHSVQMTARPGSTIAVNRYGEPLA